MLAPAQTLQRLVLQVYPTLLPHVTSPPAGVNTAVGSNPANKPATALGGMAGTVGSAPGQQQQQQAQIARPSSVPLGGASAGLTSPAVGTMPSPGAASQASVSAQMQGQNAANAAAGPASMAALQQQRTQFSPVCLSPLCVCVCLSPSPSLCVCWCVCAGWWASLSPLCVCVVRVHRHLLSGCTPQLKTTPPPRLRLLTHSHTLTDSHQDVEKEAEGYFKDIYTGKMSIADILALLSNFKNSTNPRERDVFECMIQNLFEEYRCVWRVPVCCLWVWVSLRVKLLGFRV